MKVKVTVSGPNGQFTTKIADVSETGDLTKAVGEAIDTYRYEHPGAPLFEKTIKVEHT
jgi:hypothetical protein